MRELMRGRCMCGAVRLLCDCCQAGCMCSAHGPDRRFTGLLCHGFAVVGAESAAVPDLRKSPIVASGTFAGIVIGGLNGPKGMPSFRDSIKPEDLPALQAYILSQAWAAYDAQEAAGKSPH